MYNYRRRKLDSSVAEIISFPIIEISQWSHVENGLEKCIRLFGDSTGVTPSGGFFLLSSLLLKLFPQMVEKGAVGGAKRHPWSTFSGWPKFRHFEFFSPSGKCFWHQKILLESFTGNEVFLVYGGIVATACLSKGTWCCGPHKAFPALSVIVKVFPTNFLL